MVFTVGKDEVGSGSMDVLTRITGPLLPCLREGFFLLAVRAIVEMDNGEEMTVRDRRGVFGSQ